MDYTIIVAGGKGTRMGASLPKQFLPVNGLPVLMQTIKRFWEYNNDLEIILVLPKDQHEYWYELCKKHRFTAAYAVADGGETRFHSVKNGLRIIPDEDGLVGVHDGVRPFVLQEVIARCFRLAGEKRAVVPVVPVVETLRQIEGERSRTVSRDAYRLVQTPQVFDAALLKAFLVERRMHTTVNGCFQPFQLKFLNVRS